MSRMSETALHRCSNKKVQQIYRETPMPRCDLNKAWVVSSKLTVYFQNISPQEHLGRATSERC